MVMYYYYYYYSLSAVTHAPFHASMLRPASQAGPMHEAAEVGKLVNAALIIIIIIYAKRKHKHYKCSIQSIKPLKTKLARKSGKTEHTCIRCICLLIV